MLLQKNYLLDYDDYDDVKNIALRMLLVDPIQRLCDSYYLTTRQQLITSPVSTILASRPKSCNCIYNSYHAPPHHTILAITSHPPSPLLRSQPPSSLPSFQRNQYHIHPTYTLTYIHHYTPTHTTTHHPPASPSRFPQTLLSPPTSEEGNAKIPQIFIQNPACVTLHFGRFTLH